MIPVLLWAGPLSIALAMMLLLLGASWFRHGPGVPTAGDGRAWATLWGALPVVGLGCSIGSVANLLWLASAIRAKRRVRALEWFRALANLLIGAANFL